MHKETEEKLEMRKTFFTAPGVIPGDFFIDEPRIN